MADSSRNAAFTVPYSPGPPSRSQTTSAAAAQEQVVRLEAQLASVTQELNARKAKARLGDYAGELINFLKRNSPDDARLEGHANDVADKPQAAEASGNPSEDP